MAVINTEEKVSIWEGIRSINAAAVILCLFSFFIGRICVFDTFYCVGTAYAGIMFFGKETRRWSVLLTILGILSVGIFDANAVKYILVLLFLAVLRGTMSLFHYAYNLRNQIVVTTASLLLISSMSGILQGITIFSAVVILLEAATTVGLMCTLYVAANIIYTRKNSLLNEYEMASVGLLTACVLCGIIDFYIGVPFFQRVYFRDVLIFVVMTASIYLGGMGSGMVISVIVSSILVVIGYMPASFVTIYVFAALIGGLFNHLDRIGIIFASTLGLLLGFALFNNRVIDMTIMGAFTCAAVISLLLPRDYFGMAGWYEKEQSESRDDYHVIDMQEIVMQQLKRFSSAFGSLGRQFQNIAYDHFSLEVETMNELIESAGESMCKDCTMNGFCWKEYIKTTYKSGYKMLRTLDKQGSLKQGDIPAEFKKACPNAESFGYTLGVMLDVYKNDCKWHENFNEARQMLSQQFNGVASCIQSLADKVETKLSFDEELEENISKALHARGIEARDVMALRIEDKKQEIHLYCNYRGEQDYKEKVIREVEKAVGRPLEIKKYTYDIEEKYCYFQLSAKRQFNVSCGMQCSAKEEVSGDVYSYFELEDGRYLLALADGMGSGSSARNESEMTIDLLEKFLEAGFESDVIIRLINSALVLKSDVECSSTIDMILIDEYTGVAEFYKSGASTSFILRDGEVVAVKAGSLPIGILSNVDVVSCKKQLKDGDILIMVTDGMLEDKEALSDRETTFKHFILEADSSNPDFLARFLMNKTKNLLAGVQNDDMTIIAARIWHNDQEVRIS